MQIVATPEDLVFLAIRKSRDLTDMLEYSTGRDSRAVAPGGPDVPQSNNPVRSVEPLRAAYVALKAMVDQYLEAADAGNA